MIKVKSQKVPHIKCQLTQQQVGSHPLCQVIREEGNPTIRCTQCGSTTDQPPTTNN